MWSKVGTLNVALILTFGFFIWFNWQMLQMYMVIGTIPETYACAVVAATIGECGFCGWIRTTKDKKLERQWEQADKQITSPVDNPDVPKATSKEVEQTNGRAG